MGGNDHRHTTELLCIGSGAKTYRLRINDTNYIRKEYYNNRISMNCFMNELRANELFRRYSWKAKLIRRGSNWYIRKYYPLKCRLDIAAPKLSRSERKEVAGKILSVILDLYIEGYAHRDIHAENVYYMDGAIKLVDFETLMRYPQSRKPPFFRSYDITGKGLSSPFRTGNMGFINKIPASISKVLGISLEEAVAELKKVRDINYIFL